MRAMWGVQGGLWGDVGGIGRYGGVGGIRGRYGDCGGILGRHYGGEIRGEIERVWGHMGEYGGAYGGHHGGIWGCRGTIGTAMGGTTGRVMGEGVGGQHGGHRRGVGGMGGQHGGVRGGTGGYGGVQGGYGGDTPPLSLRVSTNVCPSAMAAGWCCTARPCRSRALYRSCSAAPHSAGTTKGQQRDH